MKVSQSFSLVQREVTVTAPDSQESKQGSAELCVAPWKCKNQWCQGCSKHLMAVFRDQFRPIVNEWSFGQMITLTVDPKQFDGPEQAFDFFRTDRTIAKLMQQLRRKGVLIGPEWICVLEFQKNGWPHWHILVHSKFIPVQLIREGWRYGRIDITKSCQFKTHGHAFNYLTKYIEKFENSAVPGWVLRRARVRRYSTSRGLKVQATRAMVEESKDQQESAISSARAVGAITESCGTGAVVFYKIPEIGGNRYEFVCRLTKEQLEDREKRMRLAGFADGISNGLKIRTATERGLDVWTQETKDRGSQGPGHVVAPEYQARAFDVGGIHRQAARNDAIGSRRFAADGCVGEVPRPDSDCGVHGSPPGIGDQSD